MGQIISFEQAAVRAKVKKLVAEAEKAFDEYTAYRDKHFHAQVGSPERIKGIEMYKAAARIRDQAIAMSHDIQGDFSFYTKYFCMSREGCGILQL